MNVGKVNAVMPNTLGSSHTIGFKGQEKNNYENPVSRGTERNLAILSSIALSGVVGAAVGGLSTLIPHKGLKLPVGVGIAAGALMMLVTLPAKLYNTKVNAFVKQKEMDVFSRDRNLKSNLTEEVDKEVNDENVSLDKKLDDNLKLQMANRGSAIGIANVTSQAQG